MAKTTFLILLVIYFILFGLKRTILSSFHKKNELLWLSQTIFTYIFVFVFIVLMIVGVLFTQKDEYKNVSDGFEKIRNPPSKNRPHRYFDINTYKDSGEEI